MMGENEKFLVQKIKTDFDYWQGYANLFEQKERELNEKKKEVFNLFKDAPDTEEAKRIMMFIQYDYQNHILDLKDIIAKLTAIYTLAEQFNLTDQFTDSLNEKMQRVKETEKKHVFIFEKDTVFNKDQLVERVKGERERVLKNMQQDPKYKRVMEIVSKEFDGEESTTHG